MDIINSIISLGASVMMPVIFFIIAGDAANLLI